MTTKNNYIHTPESDREYAGENIFKDGNSFSFRSMHFWRELIVRV